ncbi:MAG: hypothetical protein LBV20_04965 [Treponema sp.]|jgi:hypothetical protein|nr:hypothetical protein [Treponema sp.]
MGNANISNLMIERYRLGELSQDEKVFFDNRIASDPELQVRLSDLNREDFEFRNKYPADLVLNRGNQQGQGPQDQQAKKLNTFTIISGICAAVLFVGISFPMIWNQVSSANNSGDRAKGMAPLFKSVETDLSVYLKTGQESTVYEGIPLHQGNTIQLAYTVPGVRYGVIYSVDGRSNVTLHYPYSVNGNTQLVSDKQTALEEAYMLDDAPDYEVFFFVVSKTPLDTQSIINNAESIANKAQKPNKIIDENKKIFRNYEVKSVYLKKESK